MDADNFEESLFKIDATGGNRSDRANGFEFALMHDGHAVADGLDLAEFVRGEEDGFALVLLAGMISLTRMFAADFTDGSLEQLLLAPQPLAVLVSAKILAHWLVCGLPVVLLAPLIGLQYALPSEALWVLVWSLLLGTPSLSLIGAIGAALTLGVRGSGLLVALLVLPLYIPVLIFGAGAVAASQHGMSAQAHLSLLAACSLLSLVLAPLATAAALRISVE